MSTLEHAIQVAAGVHAGQVDKGGAPYILHPLRVMMAMETEDERIVAVLHDVMEDCPGIGPEHISRGKFSEAVVDALIALTRRPDEDYTGFIDRIARNPLATRVKLADMHDNMDLTRIPNPTDKDRARVEKYARHIGVLIAQNAKSPPPPKRERAL